MSVKVINGNMTISRNNHNTINIEIGCEDSITRFLTIELTTDQFAMLVTGCHQHDIKMNVSNLDKVGKTRVREGRQVLYPETSHDRDFLEKWLIDYCQEPGWSLNSSLRSQSSTKYLENGTLLDYSVCKWVDKEESK